MSLSITTLYWCNLFIKTNLKKERKKTIEKPNSEKNGSINSNLICSCILILTKFSYKQLSYHKIMRAQWQRTPKDRLRKTGYKKKIFENSHYLVLFNCVQCNKRYRNNSLKGINTRFCTKVDRGLRNEFYRRPP